MGLHAQSGRFALCPTCPPITSCWVCSCCAWSHPIPSPPFRRLLCQHYAALQPPPPPWWYHFAASYTPSTHHSCSRPASGSLSVLLPNPTTPPWSHPIPSPPFRRLLCLHYAALQPPPWWSSYAATYSLPTPHVCSQPACGSLPVLLPIHTTTHLSYPVTSPPFRRLLCLATLCCLAAHSYPHHGCPPAHFPALLSGQPRIMVTAIDFAPPGLPSYLLASKKNPTHLALRKRTSKYKNEYNF